MVAPGIAADRVVSGDESGERIADLAFGGHGRSRRHRGKRSLVAHWRHGIRCGRSIVHSRRHALVVDRPEDLRKVRDLLISRRGVFAVPVVGDGRRRRRKQDENKQDASVHSLLLPSGVATIASGNHKYNHTGWGWMSGV